MALLYYFLKFINTHKNGLMSVWKSGEILLIFASLISPSKIILFEKQYQLFDTVFHLVIKQCVSRLIYYSTNDANTDAHFFVVF